MLVVMAWVVDQYANAAGVSPFGRWRAGLSREAQIALAAKIEFTVSRYGDRIPGRLGGEDHGDGLRSVAVHEGDTRLRVFYAVDPERSVICMLHGWDAAQVASTERATREKEEVEAARAVLARWQRRFA